MTETVGGENSPENPTFSNEDLEKLEKADLLAMAENEEPVSELKPKKAAEKIKPKKITPLVPKKSEAKVKNEEKAEGVKEDLEALEGEKILEEYEKDILRLTRELGPFTALHNIPANEYGSLAFELEELNKKTKEKKSGFGMLIYVLRDPFWKEREEIYQRAKIKIMKLEELIRVHRKTLGKNYPAPRYNAAEAIRSSAEQTIVQWLSLWEKDTPGGRRMIKK